MTPEDPVITRLEIARQVGTAYTMQPRVAAVLVAGSVARGLADELSDVELDVYWHEQPTDAEREAAVGRAGWERVYKEEAEHEWADGLWALGVKVDVSSFTTRTIDGYLDAVLSGDTEPELQVRVTALRDGLPLSGGEVIDAWRHRVEHYRTH